MFQLRPLFQLLLSPHVWLALLLRDSCVNFWLVILIAIGLAIEIRNRSAVQQ